jgi:hypothetical protein
MRLSLGALAPRLRTEEPWTLASFNRGDTGELLREARAVLEIV